MVNALDHVEGLDRDAHPEVVGPVELVGDPCHPVRALRQHLVGVLRRLTNDVEDVAYEVQRHLGVEEIAHRVHEHDLRGPPAVGLIQRGRVERHRKPRSRRSRVAIVLVLLGAHRLQSLRQSQRVTIVAARGHTVTPGHRVPSDLGPLNRTVRRHGSPLFGHRSRPDGGPATKRRLHQRSHWALLPVDAGLRSSCTRHD